MSHDQRKLLNPPSSIQESTSDEPSPFNPIPGRLNLEMGPSLRAVTSARSEKADCRVLVSQRLSPGV